ncbi:hypothetical protein Tco_0053153 [Tanacetum coccineum]
MGCSKGGLVDKFVRDPNKTPDSSQRPPQDCVKCGNPVEGPSCQGCALWRKKLKEVWFTICHENGIYQDLLNTSESSDDNTNVVNAPQEPFVDENLLSTTALVSLVGKVERLLYDNSSPRPLEDSNSDVSDAITESFSLSSIPVALSWRKLIYFFTRMTPDATRHETDDYDYVGISFLEN